MQLHAVADTLDGQPGKTLNFQLLTNVFAHVLRSPIEIATHSGRSADRVKANIFKGQMVIVARVVVIYIRVTQYRGKP